MASWRPPGRVSGWNQGPPCSTLNNAETTPLVAYNAAGLRRRDPLCHFLVTSTSMSAKGLLGIPVDLGQWGARSSTSLEYYPCICCDGSTDTRLFRNAASPPAVARHCSRIGRRCARCCAMFSLKCSGGYASPKVSLILRRIGTAHVVRCVRVAMARGTRAGNEHGQRRELKGA